MRVLDPEVLPAQKRVDAVARLLDTRFRLGGIRFGVDAVIGLVPGVGDLITLLLSFYIIAEAAKAGAPQSVLMRMIGNVAAETTLGAFPVMGDAFHIAYKANVRNARILHSYFETPKRVETKSRLLLISLLALCALMAMALMVSTILISLWIARKLRLF